MKPVTARARRRQSVRLDNPGAAVFVGVDAIAGHDVGWIVGDKQGGKAKGALQIAQLRADGGADASIEGSEGLVEKQKPRLQYERTCERDALPLAP